MSDDTQQMVFSIEKLYVKDMSLEVPGAPQVFMQPEQPQLEVQIEHQVTAIDEAMFEVALIITVSAKSGEKTLFLVEVTQAGIFQIRNIPEDSIGPILGIVCPNTLFPYAREAISDAVTRAGFPPVVLQPVSFETLYQQRLAEQQAAGGGDDGPRIQIAH